MKCLTAIGLILALLPVLAEGQQKTKKHSDVPAVFEHAHFIFVEAKDGDAFKPRLYPEDSQAIYDVQDGLQDWKRYGLALHRSEADVVLVVRKGRSLGAQTRAGISTRPPGSVSMGRGTSQGSQAGQAGQGGQAGPLGRQDDEEDPRGVGAGAEVGPANDLLYVYLVDGEGRLTGPVWQREMQDGLDAPSVPLLQQLRTAVERAYPSHPPAPQQPTP